MTMQKHNFSLILKCSCYLWCCFLNVNNWSYPQKLMSFFPKPYWNSDSYVLMFCFFISYWNTHSIWKLLYRLWCWEGLGAGGEGDNRGWDGWMASLTRWIWVWVNSGSWWWTGRPGVWPHGLWPTRLLCPWDSPGKNIGVGCRLWGHTESDTTEVT